MFEDLDCPEILSCKKILDKKFSRLISFKWNSKTFLMSCFLIYFFIFDISKAEKNNPTFEKTNKTELSYLDSKKELEDYIIDTGDVLLINFYPAREFTNVYNVSREGEIFLPRLDETYVRGLTTSELQKLLEKKYLKFLIEPEIKISIARFKSLRVLVNGEVRNPGLYKFPSYNSRLFLNSQKDEGSDFNSNDVKQLQQFNRENSSLMDKKMPLINLPSQNTWNIKRTNENVTTISDVIRNAGGITSLTDLSRIEIVRDVPLGKGGGKKRAIIDLNPLINYSDNSNDIRVFDGDIIFFPKLSKPSSEQIPRSILNGLSPRFITVDIFGRVENPGTVKLPLEATLSDAINLTGPIKPLSGKVFLIRYNEDGSVLNKSISYSANAKKGSRRNPFVKQGDLITVRNSVFGKSAGVLKEFTEPFIGIYSLKQLIEDFND